MAYKKPKNGDLVTRLKNGKWVKIPKNGKTSPMGVMIKGLSMEEDNPILEDICLVQGTIIIKD